MASTNFTFNSNEAHRAWLQTQAILPAGFRIGATRFQFMPKEAPKPAAMNLTIIALDKPTEDFAAVFTKNAFPGAPVIIGRERLKEPTLGAIVINNKISNVCAPNGVITARRFCAGVAENLNLLPNQILPSSTGVIGWSLPIDEMLKAVPVATASVGTLSLFDAAQSIMTTDLYPKIRRAAVGAGSIVGIAKGAGMIEPNMATMLVYLLTDLAIPRDTLRRLLPAAVASSFNSISVDSDTSTSDSVVLISSGAVPCPNEDEFAAALATVCRDLAEDVVRNGEGVRHVIKVVVQSAPSKQIAHALGKSVINAPLVKCAIAGNDPNVGRILMAIGKYIGINAPEINIKDISITVGGQKIFSNNSFNLNPTIETELVNHLKNAELYAGTLPKDGVYSSTINFPTHERCVEITIDLGQGTESATVLGADLTHEYVSENADYRS